MEDGKRRRGLGDLIADGAIWLYSAVMNAAGVVMEPLQRLVGVRRMPHVFLLLNLLIFGLFIPGHLGLAANGVDFDTDSASAAAALGVFASQVPVLDPLAYRLQAWRFNSTLFNAMRDRLTQVFVGELTLDEAIARMQADIDEGIRQAGQ